MEKEHQEKEILTRKDAEARIIAKAWKDKAYKQELLTNPKGVIEREFGIKIPEEVSIQITEETSTSLYMVLPMLHELEEAELSEEELLVLAGGRRFSLDKFFDKRPNLNKAAPGFLTSVSTGLATGLGFFTTGVWTKNKK